MADNKKKNNPNEKTNNRDDILSKIKNILSIIQTCFTIIALISAAAWFLIQGEASQKTNISYEVTHRKITEKWLWLHLNVVFSNVGKRPLYLERGHARVQKILPLEKNISEKLTKNKHPILPQETTVQWPYLDELHDVKLDMRINSGESDSSEFEFFIPAHIQTVKLYCFFKKSKEERMGCLISIIYDLI